MNPPQRRALVIPAALAITVLAGACLCGCPEPTSNDGGMADSGDNNGCPSGCGRLTEPDGALGTYPDGAPYCLC